MGGAGCAGRVFGDAQGDGAATDWHALALPSSRERYAKLSIDLRLGDRSIGTIEEAVSGQIGVGELAEPRR